MNFEHLKSSDYAVSTWSGGTTRQLVIHPKEAAYASRDFLWRLSSARVELSESDFTALPDYDRQLIILDGEMKLSHEGQKEINLPLFVTHAFDGGAATHARGRCTDFNLMLRKGQCTGNLQTLYTKKHLSLSKTDNEVFAIYCAKGQASITLHEEAVFLEEDETLLLWGAEGDIHVKENKNTILILAQIHC